MFSFQICKSGIVYNTKSTDQVLYLALTLASHVVWKPEHTYPVFYLSLALWSLIVPKLERPDRVLYLELVYCCVAGATYVQLFALFFIFINNIYPLCSLFSFVPRISPVSCGDRTKLSLSLRVQCILGLERSY